VQIWCHSSTTGTVAARNLDRGMRRYVIIS
jgi:hypothetical protein